MIRPAQYGFRTVKTGNRKHQPATPDMVDAARKYGLAHGYRGELGGWIYDQTGQHVAHGWGQFWYFIGGAKINRWLDSQSSTVGGQREAAASDKGAENV